MRHHIEHYRYPLELVASVAARLLAGAELSGATNETFTLAAQRAVNLLDACQARMNYEKAQEERVYESMGLNEDQFRESSQLRKKFRNGVPWLQGLLYITQKRSETEAIKPFQGWRTLLATQRRIALLMVKSSFSVITHTATLPQDVTEAEAEVEQMRLNGFDREVLIINRRDFLAWYKDKGIRDVRRESGKKGGSK